MTTFIPPKTLQKMKRLGLSESQVLDVFNSGEQKVSRTGAKMMVKKFSGYEIGIYYVQNKNTGEYVITTVWKRERR